MTGDMNDLYRRIGGLQSSVETLTKTWGEQDRQATEGRRELYRKVDELKTEVTKMTGRVDQLAEDVSEIKPAVKNFEATKNRGQGERNIIRIVWSILVAGVGALAYVINDWIHLFWPPKGH